MVWSEKGLYLLQNSTYFSVTDNMSELVWGIKNGDLDQVKDIVEQKVNIWRCSFSGLSIV